MYQLMRSPFAWRSSVSRGARLAMPAAVAAWSFTGSAQAACVNTGGSNYECSGALTTPQVFSGAGVAVTTTPGFSVNTAGGAAIDINGTGPLSYTDTNASNLTGTTRGISIMQTADPGMVTVMTNGTVTASDAAGDGIYAYVFNSAGTGLSVNAAAVSGGRIGIYAQNYGGGVTNVTATGQVTGTDWYGMVVANATVPFDVNGDYAIATGQSSNLPGDVIVQASGGVRGGITGMLVWNGGNGQLSVNTRGGAVSGDSREGIIALNYKFNGAPTNLSVTSDGISGARHGIVAMNEGSGSNTVTAYGVVSGGTGYGIAAVNGTYTAKDPINDGNVAVNGAAGTDLSITANSTVSGGMAGIYAVNLGTGATKITGNGTVTATAAASTGIYALAGRNNTSLNIQAASVSGGQIGIYAQNYGNGLTQVTASGQVTGTSWYGIAAANGSLSFDFSGDFLGLGAAGATTPTDLTVTASGGVSGGLTGVLAINRGAGMLQVDTRGGAVNGIARDGIVALNYPFGIPILATTDLSIMSDAVSGLRHGVVAMNGGSGSNTVVTNGAVSGGSGYGIAAVNGSFDIYNVINDGTFTANAAAGTDLSITANSTVSGGTAGVYAVNLGTGATKITGNGTVTATAAASTGIYALAGRNNTSLNIQAASVSGGQIGIHAQNYGNGLTQVTASGQVTGTSWYGIAAANGSLSFDFSGDFLGLSSAGSATPTDLIVTASGGVSGGLTGVLAINRGAGALQVDTRGGAVNGIARDGIVALNFPFGIPILATTDLSIMSDAVSGLRHGVVAMNGGSGSNTVVTNGAVSGGSGYGIAAVNGSFGIYDVINDGTLTANVAAGTDLSITANSTVSGGTAGIYANNQGSGPTQITARGDVSGGTVGIDALSAGTAITVDIAGSGAVRNASGATTGLALRTAGGPATVNNAGTLTGIVQLGTAGNALNNSGTWNTAGGTSTFAGATDILTNLAGGVINAAGNGAVATTIFDNVGTFVNQGRINLVNGRVGDILQINGNARFDANSVYAFDIDGTGNSDRILVSGSAQLDGTLALNAPVGTQVAVGTRYTVLNATGGVSGKWSSIQGTAFLTLAPDATLSDSYDANNSYLNATQMILVQPRAFVAAALTPNQVNTAAALDTISKTGQLFGAVALLPNDVVARNAFDQMSGEVHPSARTAMLDDSRFLREGALGRLRSAFDAPGAAPVPVMSYAPGGPSSVRVAPIERFSIWGQAYGGWGHWNGNGNAAKLNRSLGGFTVGIDTPMFGSVGFPLRVGLLAGYSNTSLGVGTRSSSGTSDNYHLGAYAGTQLGGLGVRAGLVHTWHDIRTNRFVAFPGFSDMLRANYSGNTTQVFGDIGYKMGFGGFAVEPFANLAHVRLSTHGFREVGGVAALTSAGARSSQTFTTLGARGSMSFDFAGMATIVRGSLGWRHAFNAVVPGSTFAFSGSAPLTITGIAVARDAAVVEAGLDIAFAPGATLGISYGGQFARNAQDHAIKGNLAVRF